MTPRIETVQPKNLVGKRMKLSYADYKIGQLWSSFMADRKHINSPLTNELIALTIYTPDHFMNFRPTNEFEKWATVEVSNFDQVPEGMETIILPSGLYAIFLYKGTGIHIAEFYQNIYTRWLPDAGFDIDQRPHVEILGQKYKNNDPTSEEEIWIPVTNKL
jgi:AraC family transcriptional regulator